MIKTANNLQRMLEKQADFSFPSLGIHQPIDLLTPIGAVLGGGLGYGAAHLINKRKKLEDQSNLLAVALMLSGAVAGGGLGYTAKELARTGYLDAADIERTWPEGSRGVGLDGMYRKPKDPHPTAAILEDALNSIEAKNSLPILNQPEFYVDPKLLEQTQKGNTK